MSLTNSYSPREPLTRMDGIRIDWKHRGGRAAGSKIQLALGAWLQKTDLVTPLNCTKAKYYLSKKVRLCIEASEADPAVGEKKTESELTKNFPGRRTGTEKKGNARNGATKGNVMGTQ